MNNKFAHIVLAATLIVAASARADAPDDVIPTNRPASAPAKPWDLFVDLPTGFVFVKAPSGWKFIEQISPAQLNSLPSNVLTSLLAPEEVADRYPTAMPSQRNEYLVAKRRLGRFGHLPPAK